MSHFGEVQHNCSNKIKHVNFRRRSQSTGSTRSCYSHPKTQHYYEGRTLRTECKDIISQPCATVSILKSMANFADMFLKEDSPVEDTAQPIPPRTFIQLKHIDNSKRMFNTYVSKGLGETLDCPRQNKQCSKHQRRPIRHYSSQPILIPTSSSSDESMIQNGRLSLYKIPSKPTSTTTTAVRHPRALSLSKSWRSPTTPHSPGRSFSGGYKKQSQALGVWSSVMLGESASNYNSRSIITESNRKHVALTDGITWSKNKELVTVPLSSAMLGESASRYNSRSRKTESNRKYVALTDGRRRSQNKELVTLPYSKETVSGPRPRVIIRGEGVQSNDRESVTLSYSKSSYDVQKTTFGPRRIVKIHGKGISTMKILSGSRRKVTTRPVDFKTLVDVGLYLSKKECLKVADKITGFGLDLKSKAMTWAHSECMRLADFFDEKKRIPTCSSSFSSSNHWNFGRFVNNLVSGSQSDSNITLKKYPKASKTEQFYNLRKKCQMRQRTSSQPRSNGVNTIAPRTRKVFDSKLRTVVLYKTPTFEPTSKSAHINTNSFVNERTIPKLNHKADQTVPKVKGRTMSTVRDRGDEWATPKRNRKVDKSEFFKYTGRGDTSSKLRTRTLLEDAGRGDKCSKCETRSSTIDKSTGDTNSCQILRSILEDISKSATTISMDPASQEMSKSNIKHIERSCSATISPTTFKWSHETSVKPNTTSARPTNKTAKKKSATFACPVSTSLSLSNMSTQRIVFPKSRSKQMPAIGSLSVIESVDWKTKETDPSFSFADLIPPSIANSSNLSNTMPKPEADLVDTKNISWKSAPHSKAKQRLEQKSLSITESVDTKAKITDASFSFADLTSLSTLKIINLSDSITKTEALPLSSNNNKVTNSLSKNVSIRSRSYSSARQITYPRSLAITDFNETAIMRTSSLCSKSSQKSISIFDAVNAQRRISIDLKYILHCYKSRPKELSPYLTSQLKELSSDLTSKLNNISADSMSKTSNLNSKPQTKSTTSIITNDDVFLLSCDLKYIVYCYKSRPKETSPDLILRLKQMWSDLSSKLKELLYVPKTKQEDRVLQINTISKEKLSNLKRNKVRNKVSKYQQELVDQQSKIIGMLLNKEQKESNRQKVLSDYMSTQKGALQHQKTESNTLLSHEEPNIVKRSMSKLKIKPSDTNTEPKNRYLYITPTPYHHSLSKIKNTLTQEKTKATYKISPITPKMFQQSTPKHKDKSPPQKTERKQTMSTQKQHSPPNTKDRLIDEKTRRKKTLSPKAATKTQRSPPKTKNRLQDDRPRPNKMLSPKAATKTQRPPPKTKDRLPDRTPKMVQLPTPKPKDKSPNQNKEDKTTSSPNTPNNFQRSTYNTKVKSPDQKSEPTHIVSSVTSKKIRRLSSKPKDITVPKKSSHFTQKKMQRSMSKQENETTEQKEILSPIPPTTLQRSITKFKGTLQDEREDIIDVLPPPTTTDTRCSTCKVKDIVPIGRKETSSVLSKNLKRILSVSHQPFKPEDTESVDLTSTSNKMLLNFTANTFQYLSSKHKAGLPDPELNQNKNLSNLIPKHDQEDPDDTSDAQYRTMSITNSSHYASSKRARSHSISKRKQDQRSLPKKYSSKDIGELKAQLQKLLQQTAV